MEKSNKRGKIPQTDWPLIMSRYEAGETLASIARTYDCSPPAISYIVSRSREHPVNEVSAPPASEPQLVKAHGDDSAPGVEPAVAPKPAPAATAEIRREPIPEPRAVGPANGDQRRTLFLGDGSSNGNASHAPTNGNGHAPEPMMPNERPAQSSFAAPRLPQPQAGERPTQRPFQAPPPRQNAFDAGRDLFAAPQPRPAYQQPREADAPRKDSGTFIDQQLRSRIDGDIAAFLAAFDAALAEDTQASRFGLREATDRLLRAGARTRIELERLEARVPLPPRDVGAAADPGAWRHR